MTEEQPAAGDEATLLTERGRRTRERLVSAARTVFERDGFHEARVTDISREAGVAHGTFYTYFEGKLDVFREVVLRMQAAAMRNRDRMPPGETPQDRITRANRAYFDSYRRDARMMAILEQVAATNDEFRHLRRQARVAINLRSARAIQRWQEEGLVDPALDARYVASALGSMVDRSLYIWLVLGEPFDEDKGLETLNTLCARALGFDAT
jgi:AcrR family transcriptional regulator